MHPFYDSTLNTWRLITEKLPEKPEFKGDGATYSFAISDYTQAIAALKQNALTVGNPEIFVIDRNGTSYAKTHTIMPYASCPMRINKDELYFWPGGYKTREIYDKRIVTAGGVYKSNLKNVAMLTLPEEHTLTKENISATRLKPVSEEKKNTVENPVGGVNDLSIISKLTTSDTETMKAMTASGSVNVIQIIDNQNAELASLRQQLKERKDEYQTLYNSYSKHDERINQLMSKLKEREESIKELLPLAAKSPSMSSQEFLTIVDRAKSLLDKQ